MRKNRKQGIKKEIKPTLRINLIKVENLNIWKATISEFLNLNYLYFITLVVWTYFLNARASVFLSKQYPFSLPSMKIPNLPITHPLDSYISKNIPVWNYEIYFWSFRLYHGTETQIFNNMLPLIFTKAPKSSALNQIFLIWKDIFLFLNPHIQQNLQIIKK